ncbi:hypothetical protein [Thermococcus sp.]|nr:hypothetical protein [Thermococcus sp.]
MGEIILSGARYKLAWWQILPVGISLGILAFSFIGIADEIKGRFLKG